MSDTGDPDQSGADLLDARNLDTGPGWLLVGKLAPPEQRIKVASRDSLLRRLDEGLSRSVAGMILSVARAGVNVGPLEVAARQQSIDPNVRPIALALLDAIQRSGRRTILILDDFHRARSRAATCQCVSMRIASYGRSVK